MISWKSTVANISNGFLLGLAAVLITATIGFVVGLIALAQGNSISVDFESNIAGLIGLVAFSITFWSLPAGAIGALVAVITGSLAMWRPWFANHRRALLCGAIALTWLLAVQTPSLPFRQGLMSPDESVATKGILWAFVAASLGMAFVLGGRLDVSGNQEDHSVVPDA